jgi:CO/xanthine dehydrogenase Mo-binding subunit
VRAEIKRYPRYTADFNLPNCIHAVVESCFAKGKITKIDAGEAPKNVLGEETERSDGDADRTSADAAVKVNEIYRTPFEHQWAIEMHATHAVWENE